MKVYNNIFRVLAILCTLCLGSYTAFALELEQNGVSKGSLEMTVYGSTQSSDPGETFTMLGGGAGLFITDAIQVGGDLFLVGSAGNSTLTTSGFGKLHFNNDNPTILPYVGAKLGLAVVSGTNSDTGFSLGINGGGKAFVQEDVSANAEAFAESMSIGGSSVTNVGVRISISIYN